jgi:hypothetical protein
LFDVSEFREKGKLPPLLLAEIQMRGKRENPESGDAPYASPRRQEFAIVLLIPEWSAIRKQFDLSPTALTQYCTSSSAMLADILLFLPFHGTLNERT